VGHELIHEEHEELPLLTLNERSIINSTHFQRHFVWYLYRHESLPIHNMDDLRQVVHEGREVRLLLEHEVLDEEVEEMVESFFYLQM
jgi:hypothetical protein